jgi:hypothetical protein
MAEQAGPDDRAEDRAAFRPEPQTYRAIVRDSATMAEREVTLKVYHLNDLPYHQLFRLFDAEDKAVAGDARAIASSRRESVGILCPDAAPADLDALSQDQMIEVGVLAVRPRSTSGQRPTGSPEAGNGSASHSPAPLVSSAGATTP